MEVSEQVVEETTKQYRVLLAQQVEERHLGRLSILV